MRKSFLTSLLIALSTSFVWAIPAKNRSIKHIQPDGSVLTLHLAGDEHCHFYLNESDGTRMMPDENGKMQVIGEERFLSMKKAAETRLADSNKRRATNMRHQKGALGDPQVIIGEKKGIVILVNFKDTKMKTNHDQACFDAMFNQEGYNLDNHIGSVADFFHQQSYGQFSLDFDVVGPVTLSQNMSYYGGNDWYGNDQRPGHMTKEACDLVDSQVNFADYDWDGDGYVDQVFVVYAGYAESAGASSNTIWPHEWNLTSAGVGEQTYDGVKVSTYACSSELDGTSGSTLDGIGTACHEFSHCLGYPDSYDIDYSGGIGMNAFDVMDRGSYNGPNYRGEVPCGYSAYQRWMAGWLIPTVLDDPATIADMEAINDQGEAYIIYNGKNSDEFFMLENRQKRGWFQYFVNMENGHGLFISHIDFNASVWEQNSPNNDPNHQRLTWVAADKSYGTYNSYQKSWSIYESDLKGDFFPGTQNVASFNPAEYGSVGGKWFTKDTNNTYYSPHQLTEITESNGKINFLFDGGDTGERFTVTFHAGNGMCDTETWSQTKSSTEGVMLPTATIESEEWAFAGWCTETVGEVTYEKPLLKEAGTKFVPTADTTLYAVYAFSLDGTPNTTPSAWCSTPTLTELSTPTLTFANTDNMVVCLGDTYTNTLTVEGSTATVTYSSTKSAIATVDAVTGQVTPVKVGETEIIAKVQAIMGVSKAASASYKLKVKMATLTTLEVKTPPSKVRYMEKETFNPAGLVLTASYANGYRQDITSGFTYSPNGPLQLSDEKVTVSYTEGEVTLTQDIAITVEELPRYTLTFVAGGGKCEVTELKQSEYKETLTMPVATIDNEEWFFGGWSLTQVEDSTAIRPTMLKAGAEFVPDNDYTLFAVYMHADGEGEKWARIELNEEIEEGTYALVTPDGHAFNGEIAKGHGLATADAFDFDANGEATVLPEGACELTLQKRGNGWALFSETLGYLYAKANKSGNLAWQENEGSYWRLKNASLVYSASSAHLRTYQNGSFRTYSSKINDALLLAKKVNGANYIYAHTPEDEDPGVGPSALESIGTTQEQPCIHTLDGRRKDAEPEHLPAGIYVVNGRKWLVR